MFDPHTCSQIDLINWENPITNISPTDLQISWLQMCIDLFLYRNGRNVAPFWFSAEHDLLPQLKLSEGTPFRRIAYELWSKRWNDIIIDSHIGRIIDFTDLIKYSIIAIDDRIRFVSVRQLETIPHVTPLMARIWHHANREDNDPIVQRTAILDFHALEMMRDKQIRLPKTFDCMKYVEYEQVFKKFVYP